jgi:hypothetical protein
MSSTFTTVSGTVSFIATTESWSEEARAEVSVLGFPGGDAVAISIGGQRETRRAFTAVFDSVEDYRTFRDMRARAGWLLVENWDDASVQAVLISVKPDPPWISGEVTCAAQFVLY